MQAATEEILPRGRNRKPGPRTKGGRLTERRPATDKGTAELQRLREWFAGEKGHLTLTTYPLGILRANEVITQRQHEAGCEYAFLHAVVYGRKSIAASSYEHYERGHEGDWDDRWLRRKKTRLKGLSARLDGHPRLLRSVLESLVVYERVPRWMRPVRPRIADVREAGLFVVALKVLNGEKLKQAA